MWPPASQKADKLINPVNVSRIPPKLEEMFFQHSLMSHVSFAVILSRHHQKAGCINSLQLHPVFIKFTRRGLHD